MYLPQGLTNTEVKWKYRFINSLFFFNKVKGYRFIFISWLLATWQYLFHLISVYNLWMLVARKLKLQNQRWLCEKSEVTSCGQADPRLYDPKDYHWYRDDLLSRLVKQVNHGNVTPEITNDMETTCFAGQMDRLTHGDMTPKIINMCSIRDLIGCMQS